MVITAVAMVVGMIGCNTPKATERRDIKRVAKAQARNPHVVAGACTSFYPTTDSTHETTIYKPGEKIVLSDTMTITDTLTNTLTKYITRTEKTHDTAYITRYVQKVDNAKVTAQAHEITVLKETVAKKSQTIKWLMWLAIIFGGYSIIRWAVRMIWGLKLP